MSAIGRDCRNGRLRRHLLDRAVNSFDLAIGPWVVWFGQPMLDLIGLADHVELHLPRIRGVTITRLLGELDAVGQDRMNAIRDGFAQMFEELPGRPAIHLVHELGDGKLAGPVNAHKEPELALHRLNLSDVDVKKANGVSLEQLPLRLVALDIRQARDAMAAKATM